MTPGDIYEFVFPDVGGHEQHGRRPAVVIQDDGYAGWLRTTIVVPLSSQLGPANFPGVVLVPRTRENGLRQDSVALVFQVRVVDRRKQSSGRWGRVDDTILSAIHDALDRLLGRSRPPGGLQQPVPTVPPSQPPVRPARSLILDPTPDDDT